MKNFELASPSKMSHVDRAGEITAILAAAIVRTLIPDPNQRTSATPKGLGFLSKERVHTTPYQQERL